MIYAPEQHIPPEYRRDSTIKHNVELMNTEMSELLKDESMGGNAGFEKINGRDYPMSAANGYYDYDSGEIVRFGNIQNIPKPIKEKFDPIQFHVARIYEPSMKIRRSPVVDVIYGKRSPKNTSDSVINESIDRYNIDCAGDFKSLYFILQMMGEIKGSDGKTYSADELTDLAEKVRKDEISNRSLTRTSGFREKVIELVGNEYEKSQR